MEMVNADTRIIYPRDDLMEHELGPDSDDCVCGPTMFFYTEDGEPLENAVLMHWPLDSRPVRTR
jgi:hypothetical protein